MHDVPAIGASGCAEHDIESRISIQPRNTIPIPVGGIGGRRARLVAFYPLGLSMARCG